jgi:anaerobic carbon-monoxide dehydrogenase catalytic subunit
MAEEKIRSADPASLKMLDKAAGEGVRTVFDRAATLKPCPIGAAGTCCSVCAMGPCRIPPPPGGVETPEEKKRRTGVCGATAETIAARNFARRIAAGTAAHADHARRVVAGFLMAARGETPDFKVKDEGRLLKLAADLGLKTEGRKIPEIARELGERLYQEFSRQEGELTLLQRAPAKRLELWRRQGVTPRGIDREVVELLHRTHMGVDQDYKNLLKQGVRTALADGWGGSMVATELQDILYGTPEPLAGEINLGVLRADEVNIIVHGHEPALAEVLAAVTRDPELLAYARTKGAQGINLAGMCCTANEVLMRRGVPIAGNFLQQELAIVTGAVEVMVVDVQCIMQGLVDVAGCYHTRIITTDNRAKIDGATHIEFDEHRAVATATEIVRLAIDNFPNRSGNVMIPPDKAALIGGFSHETINYMLGGRFRSSYRPLNDNIANGLIRGVAGVVGCNNARTTHDDGHLRMIRELIKNDVLVLSTGCGAMAAAKAGLMVPEAARFAGPGLASVCEAVGMPPVLHMGACVDNSRILVAASAMVKEGGLGDDIADLPVAGAAPEWMSEKAIAIGQYFVGSGVFTVFGATWPTLGSRILTDYLFKDMEKEYGGMWAFEPDPVKAAHLMIDHIDKKRRALGIDKARERVLYDMAMRRDLDNA